MTARAITPSLLIFVAFQPRRAIELLRNAERLAILPSVAIQLPTPILVGGSALIIVGGQVRAATATLERRIKVTRLLLRRAAAQVGSAEVGFARSASHGNVLFPGKTHTITRSQSIGKTVHSPGDCGDFAMPE